MALWRCYQQMDVPDDMVAACQVAARKLRDPMHALIPLIWSCVQTSSTVRVNDIDLPPSSRVEGVPAYALDLPCNADREDRRSPLVGILRAVTGIYPLNKRRHSRMAK